MSVILGIDPGEHTGYCVFDSTTSEILDISVITLSSMKTALVDYYDAVAKLFDDFKVTEIVLENIHTTQYMYAGLKLAVELIGVIKYMCQANDIPLKMQMPTVKKSYVKEAKDILGKGTSEHEKDALCHVLYYMDKKDKKDKNIIEPEVEEEIKDARIPPPPKPTKPSKSTAITSKKFSNRRK